MDAQPIKGHTQAEKVFRIHLRLLLITVCLMILSHNNTAAQDKNLVVRIAKLEIDPAQLESYKDALKEEIEISVRVEPGVLTLNAVAEKNHPTHITIMEIYANAEAYKSHLETPHFKKYKSTTKDMVKSLELVETVPVALETKGKR